jgi:hypothetical protein
MKYVKMLGLLAVAAAALMAFAGPASASTLTSPAGTTLATGSTIEATSSNSKLHGSFITVECSHSQVKGTVSENATKNKKDAGGSISTLDFTGCNYTVTVSNAGSLSIASNGTVTSTGAAITIHTSVGECVFSTSNTTVGTLTGGSGATLDINSASIPRTGGSFFCGSSGVWTGNYTVTSPSYLAVH